MSGAGAADQPQRTACAFSNLLNAHAVRCGFANRGGGYCQSQVTPQGAAACGSCDCAPGDLALISLLFGIASIMRCRSALRPKLDGRSRGCCSAEWPSGVLGSSVNAAVPCGFGQCMPPPACRGFASTTAGLTGRAALQQRRDVPTAR